MRIAAKPGLYDPVEETPRLHGMRCARCGATFFPPVGIGCEVCGADESGLVPTPLAAAGLIHSVATVHLHAGSDIEAPFTIADVQLDDGPLVRVMCAEIFDAGSIGRRAEARWVVVRQDDDGNDVVEPRFAVAAQ